MNELSQHFTLDEFVATQHRNIDNSLPQPLLPNAIAACNMLERIRHALGDLPIGLSSGYRCLVLNRAVGSSDTSDHLRAMAADWTCRAYGDPYKICMYLKDHVDVLGIGQLIYEFGTWVHTSTRIPDNPINRVITIDRHGTRIGIQPIRP
jgi:zinc D-Ala-D-Ala carboxypeptidase